MDCSRATVPCGEANIKPVTPPAIPTRPGGPGTVDTTRRAPHNPAGTRILSMRGSRSGECPERQRGRTVNPLAYAFVGSSPTSPTTLKLLDNHLILRPRLGPFLCRVCCMIFPSIFNGRQRLPAAPCNIDATCFERAAGAKLRRQAV